MEFKSVSISSSFIVSFGRFICFVNNDTNAKNVLVLNDKFNKLNL